MVIFVLPAERLAIVLKQLSHSEMKSYTKKYTLFFYCFLLNVIWLSATNDDSSRFLPEYDEALVVERLEAIEEDIIEFRNHSVVRSYIKSYVHYRPEKGERVLGRAVMYLPLFEEYLKKHNLPSGLKYLPIVESALVPRAVSRVGALGLWQFMPGTGREQGLVINRYIDERCDPHKATEAALNYLQQLYNRYDNWELALAAYNAGPGRVNRAIRRGRSKDFWRIRRYLPRETRNYVPAFIAAVYLMKYYDLHGLQPRYPNLDLQLTASTKVYGHFSFYRIAQVTGISLDVITALNPSYSNSYIPANPSGNYLILPSRAIVAFEDYLQNHIPINTNEYPELSAPVFANRSFQEINEAYFKSYYQVQEGETLAEVASAFNYSIHHLLAWNKVPQDTLAAGQQLVIYHPKEIKRFKFRENLELVGMIPSLPIQELDEIPLPAFRSEYLHYTLSKKEKPSQIARKTGVNLDDLMTTNNLKADKALKPGTKLRLNK